MKNNAKTGLTLVEVTVTSVIVSIILFGMMSVNSAMNNSSIGNSKRSVVSATATTVLNNVINTAASATGTGNNLGIRFFGDSFCVRTTELNLAEQWTCYTVSVTNSRLYNCTVVGAPAACTAANWRYIGAVAKNTFSNAAPNDTTFSSTTGIFKTTVTTCFDSTNACCETRPVSCDQSTNPWVQKTSSVYPTAHSL